MCAEIPPMRPLSLAESPAQPTSSTRSSSPAFSAARYLLRSRAVSGAKPFFKQTPPGVKLPLRGPLSCAAKRLLLVVFLFSVVLVVKDLVRILRTQAHIDLSALDVRIQVAVKDAVGHRGVNKP